MADEATQRIAIELALKTEAMNREAKRAERALAALERKYDPLSRASQRLDKDTERLSKALEAGTITIGRHNQLLERAQEEYRQTEARIKATTSAAAAQVTQVNGLGGVFQRHRASIQQAGYQIGDFAVQVGSGTNALIAFSQQGSQLLGAFGVFGAVAGAGIAIAAPLIRAFFDMGEEAKTAEDRLEDLAAATDLYADAADAANAPIDDLKDAYGDLSDEIERALGLQRDLARVAAEQALGKTTGLIRKDFEGIDDLIEKITRETRRGFAAPGVTSKAIRDLRDEFGLTVDQAQRLSGALKTLEEAEGPRAIFEAAKSLQIVLEGIAGTAEESARRYGDALRRLIQIQQESAKIAAIDTETAPKPGGVPLPPSRPTNLRLSQEFDDAEKAAKAAADAAKEAARERADAEKAYLRDITRALEEAARAREGLTQSIEDQAAASEFELSVLGKSAGEQARLRTEFELTARARREGIDLTERMQGSERTYAEAIQSTAAKVGEYAAAQERLAEQKREAIERDKLLVRAQEELGQALVEVAVEGRNFGEVMEGLARSIAKAALQAALFGSGPFGGGGKGGGLLGTIFSGIGGLFGGGGGLSFGAGNTTGVGGAGFSYTSFGGPRADGGPVQGGRPYLVNERTPNSEIFVPSASGAILTPAQAKDAITRAATPRMGAAGAAGEASVRIVIDEAPGFAARVRTEADGAAVRVVRREAPGIVRRSVSASGEASRETKSFAGI